MPDFQRILLVKRRIAWEPVEHLHQLLSLWVHQNGILSGQVFGAVFRRSLNFETEAGKVFGTAAHRQAQKVNQAS